MTRAKYEWCEYDPKARKRESLVPPIPQPTLLGRGDRIRHPSNGTGSKRPKVRCPQCGRYLTVKTVDWEPASGLGDFHWRLPRHKKRVPVRSPKHAATHPTRVKRSQPTPPKKDRVSPAATNRPRVRPQPGQE